MVHDEPVRADATRNADAILQAARDVVAEQGVDAPMSAIAARAGLAVGTLYRHHPSKEHLVAAVVEDATRRMVALLEDALAAEDAADLEDVLREVAEIYASDRAFKESRARGGSLIDLDDDLTARGWRAFERLLDGAQAAGTLRADVVAEDVVELLAGVPADAARRGPYLAVVLRGLRPA